MAKKDVEAEVQKAEERSLKHIVDFKYQIFWVIFFLSVFIIAAFGLIAEA